MLTIKNQKFYLNDVEFKIYSGAIHYFRSLPMQWEDRLLKLKAAGFNTVETYVCWNLHEPHPGEFCFFDRLDLVKFLKLAQKIGLYAIVRPGPYICAEWDMGGLPAWLLQDKNMRIRAMHQPFLKCVERYYTKLFSLIADQQITRGGNIIAMQIENEYGHYGSDKEYLTYVKELMLNKGCEVFLFTSDGNNEISLNGGTLPEVYKTINFGSHAKESLAILDKFANTKPPMCMEFWVGWFDWWGKKHHTRKPESVLAEIDAFLEADANFNIYMFHGGTNFGFTAGANYHIKYAPTTTSYDYFAILNEWGDYTPVYFKLRERMLKAQGLPETKLPPAPKTQTIGVVELTSFANLFTQMETIGKTYKVPMPESMEYFGQNFGYIHYQTNVCGNWKKAILLLKDLHDFAYIYVNNKFVKKIDSRKRSLYKMLSGYDALKVGDLADGVQLDIFVDAMGRVNFGDHIMDRKGISEARLICLKEYRACMDFTVFSLPMEDLSMIVYTETPCLVPGFLKGTFIAQEKADCFVRLKGFTKGFVMVNGFNLGRFWKVGPQQTLYLPGCILQDENEIIVFEQEGYTKPQIEIIDHPIYGKKG